MRVHAYYTSKADFVQMNGVRQLLVPIVSRFYQYETSETERIKEESLPMATLFNCVDTILDSLYGQDYPELSINEIWDSLKVIRGKPESVQIRPSPIEQDYYYHVHRWYEATVIFGAVYFVMALEHPEMKDCLSAIKNRASCCSDTIPYFIVFEEEYEEYRGKVQDDPALFDLRKEDLLKSAINNRNEKQLMNRANFLMNSLRTQQVGAPPEVQVFIYENEIRKEEQKENPNPYYLQLLDLLLRAERAKIDYASRQIPEGYVSVDAILSATENYFKNDAERILNALAYVVAEANGSELERINAKKLALMQPCLPARTPSDRETGMTTNQQALFFYYLFNSLGLNFHNSDKAAWVRLIHSVTGRNTDNIKQRLNFRYEEEQTQKDLRYVAGCLQELFPSISSQIDRDSSFQ